MKKRTAEMSKKTEKPEKNKKSAEENSEERKSKRREDRQRKDDHDKIRTIAKWASILILSFLLLFILAGSFLDMSILQTPKKWIVSVITPVQRFFSGITGDIADYVQNLKYRSRLETEYEELLRINEDLRNQNAVLTDYEEKVNQLYDLLDEKNEFASMSSLPAAVIGHDTGTYFSMLELNVGSNQGVKEYMAVISNGGLVGYTYNVKGNTCSVRCIIDSSATVAGMLKTSRDQGSVTGTLGVDGKAMCRMYYLPENSLPRPGEMVVTSGVGMEFPKGLPIGTVRESTRGMDEKKSYVVIEPYVDFQHLEYVIVLLYQPTYAEDAENRTGVQSTLTPLATARPVPTFQIGVSGGFHTAAPTDEIVQSATPTPTAVPLVTATPSATEDPNATPRPTNIVYIPSDPNATPTPSPTPEPTPTPTPMPTFNPNLSMEDEDEL